MPNTPLDPNRILAETFVARVEHYASIDSTNDRAKQLAQQGAGPLPLLIVAEEQTAGRGRGASRWWTGRGSLAMSLMLPPPTDNAVEQGRPSMAALAAAMAVVDTVAPLLPEVVLGIQWPNDVMAADRKLAGILVEVLSDRRSILGIGVNTNNTMADAPAELRGVATTLRDLTGRPYDATELLIALLGSLQTRLRQAADAPETLGRQVDCVCLQRGQTLALELGGREITGVCRGIAPDGGLILELPDGCQQRFYSGTLRHRPRLRS